VAVCGRSRDQQGSVTLLVAGALLLAALVAGGLAELGAAAADRARVDAVADVVALAGVTGGRAAAAELAGRNGARLTGWLDGFGVGDGPVGRVVVEVARNGISARAAAGAGPGPDPVGG
jgi:hypothetical protein